MIPRHRAPTHPGEMLYEEFLVPKRMSQMDLSRKLGVPIQRINTLVNGKRGVTAETAWLLARALDTTPEFWMNLQAAWDLYHAGRELGLVAGSAR